jgi:hypothetical protein
LHGFCARRYWACCQVYSLDVELTVFNKERHAERSEASLLLHLNYADAAVEMLHCVQHDVLKSFKKAS